MTLEHRLGELIGGAAGRLHTARSRNDQVATDFRLWVRSACRDAAEAIVRLQSVLVARAEEHAETIMPGFTHLQVAQPVTLGHHLLAYAEMLQRDVSRLFAADERAGECPLGSAALGVGPVVLCLLLAVLLVLEFFVRGLWAAVIGLAMATLVALTFMQLARMPGLPAAFALAAVFWLMILMGLGSMDPVTRHDIPVDSLTER